MTEKRLFCKVHCTSTFERWIMNSNHIANRSSVLNCATEHANLCHIYFFYSLPYVYNILSMFIFRLRLRHHVYVYSSRIEGVVWKPTCNAFTLHFKIIAIFFFSGKCTNRSFENANRRTVEMVQWHEFMPLKRICPSNWQNSELERAIAHRNAMLAISQYSTYFLGIYGCKMPEIAQNVIRSKASYIHHGLISFF